VPRFAGDDRFAVAGHPRVRAIVGETTQRE
jgi:hypothetical protein